MTAVPVGFTALEHRSLSEALERASEFDADFVEVKFTDFDPSDLVESAEHIRTAASTGDFDIFVHLPYAAPDLMLASSEDSVREMSLERFRSSIDMAAQLDARKAVVHVDAHKHLNLVEVGRITDLDATVSALEEYATAADIELCIENLRGTSRRRLWPGDVARLCERIDASMTLDTGHARTIGYSDEDIADFVRRHADHIGHVHLNDTREPADEHLPFGAGTTDFERIFAAFPTDWVGTINVEVKVTDYDYIAVSLQKLRSVLETGGIATEQ